MPNRQGSWKWIRPPRHPRLTGPVRQIFDAGAKTNDRKARKGAAVAVDLPPIGSIRALRALRALRSIRLCADVLRRQPCVLFRRAPGRVLAAPRLAARL